jgi:hypothetical protein
MSVKVRACERTVGFNQGKQQKVKPRKLAPAVHSSVSFVRPKRNVMAICQHSCKADVFHGTGAGNQARFSHNYSNSVQRCHIRCLTVPIDADKPLSEAATTTQIKIIETAKTY